MSFPYGSTVDGYINEFSSYYNGNAYNALTNPGGLANGGHRINFTPILQKYSAIASSVADAANYAATQATNAATSATSALASQTALTGTSTTSVSIGSGSKSFITQGSKAFNVGTWVDVVSDASPTTHYMLGQVTAYNDVSGALTINVTAGTFGGSGSRADWTIYGRAGAPGATGSTGATGSQGATPAFQWNFDSVTTDADPGAGLMRFNSATYSSVTYLYVDNLDRFGADQQTFLDSLDDSTNTTNRGTIFIQQTDTFGTYAVFALTSSPGTIEDGTGYRKIPVSFVMSSGVAFGAGQPVAFAFYRSGNKGTDGAGAGDVISDIGSSTVGRIATFNSTDGKHITQSSFSIGTSGTAIGALSTANTWGAAQSFGAKVDLQQDWGLSGDITPAQITSNQDNYAPTGNATASVFRLSSDASRNITGIANGYDGRMLMLLNIGSFNIVLMNDVTSTEANRFLLGNDFALASGQALSLIYDATSLRWRAASPIGSVSLASGSVSSPSLAFGSDPNTGLYSIGSDNIGVTAGGTKILDIHATNGVDVTTALKLNGGHVWSTGDVKMTIKTAADTGWVMMNDGTIGNASSGGTARANADTEALFTLLWNNISDTYAPVSSGRGASAAADFAANKNIKLLTVLGRVLGKSGAGVGLTSRALGENVGLETESPTEAKTASHTHATTSPGAGFLGFPVGAPNFTFSGASAVGVVNAAPTGSGTALNIMQPSVFINVMIKL